MSVFLQRTPPRRQAKAGGPPPTEVKGEERAKPGPEDMEWEGARRSWLANPPSAEGKTQRTAETVRNGAIAAAPTSRERIL